MRVGRGIPRHLESSIEQGAATHRVHEWESESMRRDLARREFFVHVGVATAGYVLSTGSVVAGEGGLGSNRKKAKVPVKTQVRKRKTQQTRTGGSVMAHVLPELPYDFNALEPFIDEQTMRIHHGKHHAAYVAKLNTALEGHPELAAQPIEKLLAGIGSLPEAIRMAVRHNGGGHYNHSLFWPSLAPKGTGGEPTGDLATAIERDLSGFNRFRETFTKTAAGVFGSGWAWLCAGCDGKLCVCSTPNQDSPIMKGVAACTGTPLLGLDVWEHAYYLKYQNRRPDYIEAWWNIVNWKLVGQRYAEALAGLEAGVTP